MRRIYLRIGLGVNRHPARKVGLGGRLLCWPIGRRNVATMNGCYYAFGIHRTPNAWV
jgi:hypothetical protein